MTTLLADIDSCLNSFYGKIFHALQEFNEISIENHLNILSDIFRYRIIYRRVVQLRFPLSFVISFVFM